MVNKYYQKLPKEAGESTKIFLKKKKKNDVSIIAIKRKLSISEIIIWHIRNKF